MKYLVDANVLSEATRRAPEQKVMDWLRRHEPELVVNPIILGELEYGILILPDGRRRKRLEQWFVEGSKRLRVLEFGAATAGAWARLLSRLKVEGHAMPIKDSLIAATAIEHKLTVVTRNIDDFRYSGANLVNPFK